MAQMILARVPRKLHEVLDGVREAVHEELRIAELPVARLILSSIGTRK
jgi:hypothetical protein